MFQKRFVKEHTARTIIRIYGVFVWVLGLILLEGAFGFLRVNTQELFDLFGMSLRASITVMLLIGLFLIFLGFQVQQYKHWSRFGALAFGAFALVMGIYLTVRCENTCTSFILNLPLNIFRILFGIFSIWFFSHEKVVVKLFQAKYEVRPKNNKASG